MMICELCEGAIFQRWALALFVVLSRGGHSRYLLCYPEVGTRAICFAIQRWAPALFVVLSRWLRLFEIEVAQCNGAKRWGSYGYRTPPPHTAWFYRKAKSGLEA